ncbi:MAG: MFS transporter [Blastocatellia bacterium]
MLNSSDKLVKPAKGRTTWRSLLSLRWVIAFLLLLASVMNYVDRQTLSILAVTIQRDLGISDAGYARVVQAFQLTYAVMYLLSGRIVDRIGARLAQTAFMIWWSVANMLTGLAGGAFSLAFYRALLGIGEPGGYTASAKAVSEWFPTREKGVAVGMYTMGGTLGAAIAGPSIAFITLAWGWRAAFVVTGAIGLLLGLAWFAIYRPPGQHRWLGEQERELLAADGVLERSRQKAARVSWATLVRLKPMWLVLLARMVTDPLWYFYLFWFPKYLQDARGFTLADVGATVWIVFVAADIGALLGGWLSGRFALRGLAPVEARLKVMTGAALLLTLSFALPLAPGRWWPIALAALFAFAHMAWLTCATTLSVDIFPTTVIGSAHGAIGAGSALGGLLSTEIVKWLVVTYSYKPVFAVMSFLHPLSLLLLLSLLPRAVRAYHATLEKPV